MTEPDSSPGPAVSHVVLPRLPSPEIFDLVVEKYKAFRLLSLRLSPESFGSSYAEEVAFAREQWDERITSPDSINIVAVAKPDKPEDSDVNIPANISPLVPRESLASLSGEWLASLTVLGPYDRRSVLELFIPQAPPAEAIVGPDIDTPRVYFVMVATYVVPDARRKGIGRSILDFANEKAREQGRGSPVRVLLIVGDDVQDAKRLYERTGFTTSHRYTLNYGSTGFGEQTQASIMRLDMT